MHQNRRLYRALRCKARASIVAREQREESYLVKCIFEVLRLWSVFSGFTQETSFVFRHSAHDQVLYEKHKQVNE